MTPRRLEVLGEHTIDVSLLRRGGWVLDAGCRDFTFARGVTAHGCFVLAIDADPTVEAPKDKSIVYQNAAIAAKAGKVSLVMTPDPQARHLASLYARPAPCEQKEVSALTIEQLRKSCHFHGDDPRFAAVKLDVEGSEYEILLDWPGPIAKQISIEFHEHCAERPPALYDAIFAHLGQWYEVVQHVKERRHGCAANFWDSLFCLKKEFL